MAVKGWKCVRALRGVTHIQIAARVKDRNEPNYSLIASVVWGRTHNLISTIPLWERAG